MQAVRIWDSEKFSLGLILLLAFLLRLGGVHFGLPYLYHADESIVVNHALAYGTGDLNPHFFKIPPLVSYVVFLIFGLYFAVGRLFGAFQTIRDFEFFFYSDPTVFYLLARIFWGVLPGTLTVYLLYRLVVKHFDRERAKAAAFFLSVAFLHVSDSHYIYVDIPLVLVLVGGFFTLLNLLENPDSKKLHCLSGLFVGLATAVKYNGGALVIPYGALWFLAHRPKKWKLWFLGGAVAFLTYAVLNPFPLMDFKFFLKEVLAESQAHQGGTGPMYLLTHSLLGALELPLLGASFLGLLTLLQTLCTASPKLRLDRLEEEYRKKLLLAIFLAAYYAILVQWGQPYARYVLPMIPFFLIFAADFLKQLVRGASSPRRKILWIAAAVFVALPSLVKTVLFDLLLSRNDVRTQAKQWIETNVLPGSRVALDHEFYMPRLLFAAGQIKAKQKAFPEQIHFSTVRRNRLKFLKEQANGQPSYRLYSLSDTGTNPNAEFLLSKIPAPYDVNQLRAFKIDYVVVVRLWEKDLRQSFYDQLEKEATLVVEFNPYRGAMRDWPYEHPLTGGPFLWRDVIERERNGQPLKIYKL